MSKAASIPPPSTSSTQVNKGAKRGKKKKNDVGRGFAQLFCYLKKPRKTLLPTLKTNKHPQNVIINFVSKSDNIFVVTLAVSMQNLLQKPYLCRFPRSACCHARGRRGREGRKDGYVAFRRGTKRRERESQDHVTCTEREEQKQQQKTEQLVVGRMAGRQAVA